VLQFYKSLQVIRLTDIILNIDANSAFFVVNYAIYCSIWSDNSRFHISCPHFLTVQDHTVTDPFRDKAITR